MASSLRLIKKTKSLCPRCLRVLSATIFEQGGRVLIGKECPEHGEFEDVYWSNYDEFVRAQKYRTIGDGIENPMTKSVNGHPFDCGICPKHKSHTALAIIDVSNRCNLRCPICFANAATAGYVYEPTKEQVRGMLENLRNVKPVPATALQYSGGEPTLREDLPELVEMAKELGFDHVEVDSNGINLAESADYCRKLKAAGVSTIYLAFDGVKAGPYIVARGRDLLKTKIDAIENCRKAGFQSIVLVPTVVRGVNDDQLGDIIKFAAKNFDIVRGINFQPVSITGRINYEERKRMRITIPECIKLVEEQTDGQIKASDFYPVPVVVPISRAVGALKGKRYVEFTCHEHCGMATFVFVEKGELVPITHYVDVDRFIEIMNEVYEEAKEGSKTKAKLEMLNAVRYTKFGLLSQLVGSVLKEGTYKALGKLMRKMIMIGMMHFMDPYNFDLERVERCCIHYAVPDGRLIPFCTMNTIHRQSFEKKFSVPIQEWQKIRARAKALPHG